MTQFQQLEANELFRKQMNAVEVLDKNGITRGQIEPRQARILYSAGGFIAQGNEGQVNSIRAI